MVHSAAREQHGAANTRWQHVYSCSDGSGHEVMRKVQAEPGPAPARNANGSLIHDADGKLVFTQASTRWVGTGRTVFDNKGHAVKQYEPFFSTTHEYEGEDELAEQGVTPILRYDPLGRLVRTDLPNGTFSKAVFTPWTQVSYDPNDTVLESIWYAQRQALATDDPERRAANLAAQHANTPSVAHLDVLGRSFLTIADNGTEGKYETRVALDIEGNPLVITDAMNKQVMRHVFAMGGHKLHQASCDAGKRWMIADVAGKLLRAWDERGHTRRATYDALQRPTALFVEKGGVERMAERTIYGESVVNADALNLRGKVYQHYDGAGVVTNIAFDFKGSLLQSSRQLASEYKLAIGWSEANALALEAEVFVSQTTYDALNRPTSLTSPDPPPKRWTLPLARSCSL